MAKHTLTNEHGHDLKGKFVTDETGHYLEVSLKKGDKFEELGRFYSPSTYEYEDFELGEECHTEVDRKGNYKEVCDLVITFIYHPVQRFHEVQTGEEDDGTPIFTVRPLLDEKGNPTSRPVMDATQPSDDGLGQPMEKQEFGRFNAYSVKEKKVATGTSTPSTPSTGSSGSSGTSTPPTTGGSPSSPTTGTSTGTSTGPTAPSGGTPSGGNE